MSRFYRGFFGFFGFAAIMALSFGVVHVASNSHQDIGAYQLTMEPIDYGLHDVATVAVIARQDRASTAVPDETSRVYNSIKQPGQTWRTTADAYRHIDPGRRVVA